MFEKTFTPHKLTAMLLMLISSYVAYGEVNPDYQAAVEDAAFAHEDELFDGLFAINDENTRLIWNEDKSKVLVATWKSNSAYEKFLKSNTQTSSNPDYAVWVTAVPQVKNLCKKVSSHSSNDFPNALDNRLKQYLGLNPEWHYDVFVEMWVSPEDLFRPCVDPEIDDTRCQLNFSEVEPSVKNITSYEDFYKKLYYKSYRSSAGVPWTGLGYTYDWHQDSNEVGASEYILVPEAEYEIERAVSTQEYCR